jgi:two-component system, OmpR family, phosphate regulon sensor histidine kinase PhoR
MPVCLGLPNQRISKLAVTSEDLYRRLAQYAADGILVSDADGLVTYCNPAMARVTGRTPEKVVGQKLHSVIECTCFDDTKDGAAATPELVSANEESTEIHNGIVVCHNGMDLSMPVSHIELAEGGGSKGYMTIVYVIQASSVQQAQTEFVSTVSHELRTPLTSIKGFADTILRAGDRIDASSQRRYIGIIKDQADRLARLVEDLLAVSRLESRKLQLTIRAIDLNETIQRVLRNLGDKSRQHEITLKIPQGLPQVWADADRLEQILTNLIDNAIKYSPPRTNITIAARDISTSNNPEMVEFTVSDQGVGIPEEHLPEIFTKFSRLDNPLVRQTEGTGLGLYITRSLVLALGGQIHVSSGASGTTFSVQLPAASLEEQAARGRG